MRAALRSRHFYRCSQLFHTPDISSATPSSPALHFPFLMRIKWHIYENTAIISLDKCSIIIIIFLFFCLQLEILCRVSRAGERLQLPELISGPWCPIAKTSDVNNADCTHGTDPCPQLLSPLQHSFLHLCSQNEICSRIRHHYV